MFKGKKTEVFINVDDIFIPFIFMILLIILLVIVILFLSVFKKECKFSKMEDLIKEIQNFNTRSRMETLNFYNEKFK